MNNLFILALAGLAGMALGAIFFGGLWWTVRRGLLSPRPALWFLCSLLLRTGIVLAGLYWIGQEHWERLLACLSGFLAARILVMCLTRGRVNSIRSGERISDAS